MSLFDEQTPQPPGRQRPPRLDWRQRIRTVSFWMFVAFILLLLGLLFGAWNQPWFLVLVAVWVVANVILVIRASRNQPPPPNLFDD